VGRQIRRELRQAGLTARAIDAAWPDWWSSDAAGSSSARAELRFTLSRRLGLSPQSLRDGAPTFLWRDQTKYKNLTADSVEQAAISSFGVALGRSLVAATPSPAAALETDPLVLRSAILASGSLVDFSSVLALCWSFGIPVVQAMVLPTARKRMHAMSVSLAGRYAIVLGRTYTHRAQVAYVLGHELGHCLLGHLDGEAALVDLADPARGPVDGDEEETAADRFALALLTGTGEPDVQSSITHFTAAQLADAARAAALHTRVDPGVLALCLGHASGRWMQAMGALKMIPPGREDVAQTINTYAWTQLDAGAMTAESRSYLSSILGQP
jgi:hypothetical protein